VNLERLPAQDGDLLINWQDQFHADQVIGEIDGNLLRGVGTVCDEGIQLTLGEPYLPFRSLLGIRLRRERLARQAALFRRNRIVIPEQGQFGIENLLFG
jgi:hypothetical protein